MNTIFSRILQPRSAMKPVLQNETAECGLACLAMVSTYFGGCGDLHMLRRRFAISQHGATLAQLIQQAESMQLASRPLRLELDSLPELKLPCVLHWNLNHFVVLADVARRRNGEMNAIIFDPAIGECTMSHQQLSDCFTGVAVEFTPTPHFEPSTAGSPLGVGSLIGPIVGLRRAVCQVLVITLLLELLAALLPQFSQFVIDDVLVTGDVSLLDSLLAGFMLIIFSYAAVNFSRSWFLLRWSIDVNLQWATRIFAHLLRLPVDYFEKRQLGDIASRFESIGAIQNTVTSLFVESMLDAGLALLMLVLMWIYSPILTIAVLLPVLIYASIRVVLYRALDNVSRNSILLHARESSHFLETIRSMTSIRLFGREAIRGARWLNLKQDIANIEIKKQRLQSIVKTSSVALFAIQSVLLFYAGAFQVAGQQLTVGMLIAFSTYAIVFSARSCKMIDLVAELRMLDMHRERLAGIVEEPVEALQESSVDISTLVPSISLKGVSFRYAETEPWIIDNVDLTIESGQSVVLVGASGCGKTTLCKLLLGLLQPTHGEVLLDNVPITELGLRQYRQLLGTVMQDDTLLSGSIADNITFFDPYPDLLRIEICAHQAAIHDEIVAMPMAYRTLIGEMGSVLSGGQKQRILLARALYKQPRILALDEATSHLDTASEYRVNDAVRHLRLTRIIVAHRIETIATAERVLEINGGKVSEHPPLKLATANQQGGEPFSPTIN